MIEHEFNSSEGRVPDFYDLTWCDIIYVYRYVQDFDEKR